MTTKRNHTRRPIQLGLGLFCLSVTALLPAAAPKITPAKDIIGFTLGDDYKVASYTQLSTLMQKWAGETDRMKLVSIGKTEEGRTEYQAIITSPANLAKLDHWREISNKLARGRVTDAEAQAMAKEGKAVVWLDGGLHATESVNQQAIGEMIYQMISRTDDETMRFLDDCVTLLTIINPDGDELVSNWYMRNADEKQRTFMGLPRLYAKYVGHDDNRDGIMFNMSESINMARQLYIVWNPQIMHNAHQSGPAGTVVFIPPFRDPFNYDYDPLIPLGIQQLGTAMQSRLAAKGMPGGASKEAAPYSTWFNGNVRTAGYFRNQIGILTEIIGSPTPMEIPLMPEKQLADSNWPNPVAPQIWHYRQSVDYMIELYRAMIDYGSRNRETLLYNSYVMARHSIDKGNRDSWTITPDRVDALKVAAEKEREANPAGAAGGRGGRGRGGRGGGGAAAGGGGGDAVVGFGGPPAPSELYEKILHDPAFRDPRGYIITPDQDDFPTAVKFLNVLLKGGAEIMRATKDFTVAGKNYPAGSFVIKCAQAYRPLILDSFEPQHHPTDLSYPGGPPKRPYDITGWTIAAQMGVKFDRIMEGFDGPFEQLGFDLLPAPASAIAGAANPVGYLVSHKQNDAFILTNRLLKAGADVYWLKDEVMVEGKGLGTGTIYVPASAAAKPILEKGAKDLGVTIIGVAAAPKGDATKLKPVHIGLVDVYGGSMPSGWLRWMFEKYEFPFELVFPSVLEAGNLKSSYDVIVFPSGVYTEGRGGRGGLGGGPLGGGGGFGAFAPEMIPEEFRSMLGAITKEKTVPAVRKFVEDGGTIIGMGSAATIGEAMGLPVDNFLVEAGPDGKPVPVSSDKFYIPGSVLSIKFNNKDPIAYGMPDAGYVFFDSSPVFKLNMDAQPKLSRVAWFDTKTPLYSGWAIGQEHLDGGDMATEASVGAGKIVLMSFEATFRGTPHQDFKLLFNSIYFGSAKPATIGQSPAAGTN